MQYKPGDKVKIISLEKVRSYPKEEDGRLMIAYVPWLPKMDEYAGTIQTITEVGSMYYEFEDCGYLFSPEMIEGPADGPAPETTEGKYARLLEEKKPRKGPSISSRYTQRGWKGLYWQ